MEVKHSELAERNKFFDFCFLFRSATKKKAKMHKVVSLLWCRICFSCFYGSSPWWSHATPLNFFFFCCCRFFRHSFDMFDAQLFRKGEIIWKSRRVGVLVQESGRVGFKWRLKATSRDYQSMTNSCSSWKAESSRVKPRLLQFPV